MEPMTIVWLVLAVVMAVVEASTTQLVSIWFAAGAVAACITSLFTGVIWIQIVVFVAVSGAALILTRPLAKRFKEKKVEPTNSDRYIGKTAVVVDPIDNEKPRGMVLVDNQKWTARSADGKPIPEGTKVTVTAIEGVKMMVRPME